MNIEPIKDTTINTTEQYITDLENEIDNLKSANSLLSKKLKAKPKQQDISCCEAYKVIVRSFHSLLDDLLPF